MNTSRKWTCEGDQIVDGYLSVLKRIFGEEPDGPLKPVKQLAAKVPVGHRFQRMGYGRSICEHCMKGSHPQCTDRVCPCIHWDFRKADDSTTLIPVTPKTPHTLSL